jgi:hypothetical protein
MSTLGHYQMVMALSEATVNALFDGLRNEGEIHEAWSIRQSFDNHDELVETVMNEGFAEDEYPSYLDVKKKFDDAFDDVFDDAKEARIKMTGFVAKVGSPFISTLDKDYFNVSFSIPFAAGEMKRTFKDRDKILANTLDGILYVFSVALAKIGYPYSQARFPSQVAEENVRNYIEASTQSTPSLEAEDFTIESLFLNFEDADFVAVSAKTIDPNGLPDAAWLAFQTSLQLYFTKHLVKTDNPYVLGYGVTVPELQKRKAAVFQPVSLDFSTSFASRVDEGGKRVTDQQGDAVADHKKCALNYQMMVKPPDTHEEMEIIQKSLIETGNVLAIDYDLFYTSYLAKVFAIIVDELNATLAGLNATATDPKSSYLFVATSGARKVETAGTYALQRSGTDDRHFLFGQAVVIVAASSKTTNVDSRGPRTVTNEWTKTITAAPTADLSFPQYMVTEDSLAKLKEGGASDEVRNSLVSLKYRPFESRAAFRASLVLVLRDAQLKQYEVAIMESAKAGWLWINLKLREDTTYTDYQIGHGTTASTTQDGAGLHIKLHPGADGEMLIDISPYNDGLYTVTTGKENVVQSVNAAMKGGIYDKLLLPTFLATLTAKLKEGIETLPHVILPISNVYTYKSIGFIDGGPKNSAVTFQSTYEPQYQPAGS